MDGTPGSAHDLLLALAGWVDDDLLAWARELVAVGEETRAVELVTAGLAADRAALTAPVRAALVDTARTLRIDLDADAALAGPAPGAPDHTEHRFTAEPPSADDRVAAAVRGLPGRLLEGHRTLLTWRLTPAGSAPGPLPHPVLLVQTDPGGRPADVLAYQLAVALHRAGVVASVEVLTAGSPLPPYHVAARRAVRPVDAEPAPRPCGEPGSTDTAPAVPPTDDPFGLASAEEFQATGSGSSPEPDRTGEAGGEPADDDHGPSPFAPDDAVAAEPPPAVTAPGPARPAADGVAATDPTGTQNAPENALGRPAPRPVPLRAASDGGLPRRRAVEQRSAETRRPTVTPISRSPLARPAPTVRADEGQVPAPVDTPTFRSIQDPLSGPLQAPLLAPLLDPSPPGEPEVDLADGDEDPFGFHGISPLAPDAPAPVEDRWASEWASGDWALTRSDLATPGPSDAAPARHRSPATERSAPEGDETPAVVAAPPVEPLPPVVEDGPAAPRAPRPIPRRADAGRPDDESTNLEQSRPAPQAAAPRVPAAQDAPPPDSLVADWTGPDSAVSDRAFPDSVPPDSVPPDSIGPDAAVPDPAPPRPDFRNPAPPNPVVLNPAPPSPRPLSRRPTSSAPQSSAPPDPVAADPWPQFPAAPYPVDRSVDSHPEDRFPIDPSPGPEPPVERYTAAPEPPSVEAGSRLSDADRELLARLQSELGSGPRPRTSHRAGTNPGTALGSGTNRAGHRDEPPDLAG